MTIVFSSHFGIETADCDCDWEGRICRRNEVNSDIGLPAADRNSLSPDVRDSSHCDPTRSDSELWLDMIPDDEEVSAMIPRDSICGT